MGCNTWTVDHTGSSLIDPGPPFRDRLCCDVSGVSELPVLRSVLDGLPAETGGGYLAQAGCSFVSLCLPLAMTSLGVEGVMNVKENHH